MSLESLTRLEEKVLSLVGEVESLREQLASVNQERATWEAEKQQQNEKVEEILGLLSSVDETPSTEQADSTAAETREAAWA